MLCEPTDPRHRSQFAAGTVMLVPAASSYAAVSAERNPGSNSRTAVPWPIERPVSASMPESAAGARSSKTLRKRYLDSGVHHLAEARAYRWEFRPATPLQVLTPARSLS